jgi:energy-coupling factor transporter ATP-binding protein EcfA2
MRINRIHIRDFRGIEELEIDLVNLSGNSLDLAVFAGPNGSGKTSILEACLFALGRSDLIGDRPDNDVRLGATNFEICLQMNSGEDIVASSKTREKQISRNLRGIGVEYFSSWREPKLMGSLPITAGKKGKRPKATEQNRLWLIKQHLINLRARKAFESQQIFPDIEPAVFQLINDSWKQFYPGSDSCFEVRPVSESIDEGFDLFIRNIPTGQLIPVDALSSGEIEVLTMIGWFATRETNPDFLFIDEPELHLHSTWHRVVLRVLRKLLPKTQIICATHSKEVLDSVMSYQRFTLLPPDDPRIKQKGKG